MMQATYNLWLVMLSIGVAVLVSYIALSLVARVTAARTDMHRIWLIGGALAMGVGIWSMHFIGMMAFSLPLTLRYDVPTTAVSLLIAVLTSGCALSIAAAPRLGWRRLVAGSVAMGAGICAMHYCGMAAIRIRPAIGFDPMLVGASILVALFASFAALWLAFKLRSGHSWQLAAARLAAAAASARTTLRELRQFHYALDQLASVAVADLRGVITYVNDRFCELSQYPRDELLGKPFTVINSGKHPPQIFRELWESVLAGSVWRGELCNRKKNGTLYWVDTSIVPYRDEAGTITQFVTMHADITQRKLAQDALAVQQESLRTAKNAAEAANRTKSEFLAHMSHEIRTPLNGVIGMTGLLLDGSLQAQQREYAEIVRSSGESLLALINDILDFSKIEAGHLELEHIDFDLQSVIEDSIDAVALRAAEKGLELQTNIDAAIPQFFNGDPGRLRQILLNLLSNAIKFTGSGRVTLALGSTPLEASAAPAGLSALIFSISDTGIGIAADRISSLFAPFIQADSSTSRRFGGTGLGLSISKRLAQAMGGSIEVDSSIGQGSTFRFTVHLPACPAMLNDGIRLAGLRILIVSNARGSRQTFERQLAHAGCTLSFAATAAAGLQQYQAMLEADRPAAAVLIDNELDGRSGIWLAHQIRRSPAPPPALLLLTSLSTSVSDADMTVIDRVITEPVKSGALLRALAEATRTPAARPKHTRTGSKDVGALASPFRGVRILLAEDNAVNQTLASRLLQRLGAEVEIANNGLEALEALRVEDFDAVLMDCQMPEMDGYEATRQLRNPASAVRNPRIPVIALTAHALATDRAKCLAAGMDDYLTKPINPAHLQRALSRSMPADHEFANRPGADDVQWFDEPALRSRTGDDRDFARELIALFVQTGGETLWQLAQCGTDPGTLRKLAHNLKGSAAAAAAREVAARAAVLERVAGTHEAVEALNSLETSFKQTAAYWKRTGWIAQEPHVDADTRARAAK
jgi:PAS domain S-box-containing protein